MPYKDKEKARAYSREAGKKWAKANPDKVSANNRKSWLKHKYGITEDQFDTLLADQGGLCACCKTNEPGRWGRFCVDHCHSTGSIRGLLCHNCNQGIGKLGDNLEGLERAVDYLKRSTQQTNS